MHSMNFTKNFVLFSNIASFCECDMTTNEDSQLYRFINDVNRKISIKTRRSSDTPTDVDAANNMTLSLLTKNYQNYPNLTESLMSRASKYSDFMGYKWSYRIHTCDLKSRNLVVVVIQELHYGHASSGGSSITVFSRSTNTMDYCPVVDLFNGTYIAKCQIHERGTVLKSKVHFVNFAAFTRYLDTTQRVIIKENVDRYLHNVTYIEQKNKLINCVNQNQVVPPRGWWVKVNNRWRWFTGNCLVPRVNKNALSQCIKNFKQVNFFNHVSFHLC